MNLALSQIAYLVIPFLLVALLGPWMARRCSAMGLVDKPNNRSSHSTPTPRGGGMLIVGVTLPLTLYYALSVGSLEFTFLLILGLCSLAVAGIGLWDDFNPRPAWQRLLTQLIATSVVVAVLPDVLPILPAWAEKPLLVIAWVWFINLFNFLDGIDGYAAMQTAFMAIALSIFAPTLGLYTLLLAGACLGFLRVNWESSKTKVFMGDVGSTWLGFMLGGYYLLALPSTGPEMVLPLLTLTLLFSADATYTLIKRALNGEKFWQPHRDHFYQRGVRAGIGHGAMVGQGVVINFLLLIVVIIALEIGLTWLSLPLGLAIMAVAGWRIKRVEGSA